MKLYQLGNLPGFDSMLAFHAMAHLGMEGLVIVSPQEPIASVGYFQDPDTSIDMKYCKENGIGVMRREIGGGTTLLDRNQIFYQVILKKSNPLLPLDPLILYRKFSQPVIDTYKEIGINAKFKEVNDIITEEGRKITGEGGTNIGDTVVFVGGILLDFDSDTMSKILPASSEQYRIKILQSLKNNLTTVKRELGKNPDKKYIEKKLIANFEKILGPFENAELTAEVWSKARELEKYYTSQEFLWKKSRKISGVKIASEVNVFEKRYKAVGGTIHVIYETKGELLNSVNIYGDFTMLPKEKLGELEKQLIGLPLDKQQIQDNVEKFFEKSEAECPGVTPSDFAEVFFS